MNEQTTLKLPGAELPYGILHDWTFWVLIACGLLAIWIWRKK